jgi:hypothetical protein
MKFKCITSHTSEVDVHSLLDQGLPLFVSTSDINVLEEILSRTSSFSTSVGPPGFEDVIEGLEIAQRARSSDDLRKVYLFENDSERFKKHIEDSLGNEHYDIIQVICDRICTQRKISEDKVRIISEKFTGMAVIYPSQRTSGDFSPFKQFCEDINASPSQKRNSIPSLILTRTNEEAQFYYQRKLSLLNGIHFTMAVLAYHSLMNNGYARDQWASKQLSTWRSDEVNHHSLRITTQGRVLRLLYDTPTKLLETVYGTNNIAEIYLMTMEYVKTTIRRIESIPDTLGRILHLPDEKNIRVKLLRYVSDVQSWLKQNDKAKSECMRVTGIKFEDIYATFDTLALKFESICAPQED